MMRGERRYSGIVLFAAACAIAAGCGGSDAKHGTECPRTGESDRCVCPGEADDGTMTCQQDGYWSECDCSTPYVEGGAGSGGSETDTGGSTSDETGGSGTTVGGTAGSSVGGGGGVPPAGAGGDSAGSGGTAGVVSVSDVGGGAGVVGTAGATNGAGTSGAESTAGREGAPGAGGSAGGVTAGAGASGSAGSAGMAGTPGSGGEAAGNGGTAGLTGGSGGNSGTGGATGGVGGVAGHAGSAGSAGGGAGAGTCPGVCGEAGPSCADTVDCDGVSCCQNILVPGGAFMMGRSDPTNVCASPPTEGSSCPTVGETCIAFGDVWTCDQYLLRRFGPADIYEIDFLNEQPEHLAVVGDFYLDTFEVTVGRFRAFMDAYEAGWRPSDGEGANAAVELAQGLGAGATGWDSTAWNSELPTYGYEWTAGDGSLEDRITCNGTTWQNPAGTAAEESYPINCVNWYEAFAFCAWDGGRLPTEAEWEYAAAGGDENHLFPWGNDVTEPMPANYNWTDGSPFVGVGSYLSGNGRWGHADLSGSMYEWVLDWYSIDYYTDTQTGCSDCANLTATPARVLRGGSWEFTSRPLRAAFRDGRAPDDRSYGVGVRCARALP